MKSIKRRNWGNPLVGNIRGKGLLVGIELVKEKRRKNQLITTKLQVL